MGLRINTNVSAMNALRNLSITSDKTSKTIERLSTGLRINHGADDPAGLVISENLRAQIVGLKQAATNAQDAVNLTKTAEAALDELQTLLKKSRALAVHAANSGVNDINSLQADQTEIQAIAEAINRIAEQTSFGNKKLLDGTAGVSAALSAPNWVSGMQLSGTFNGLPIASGTISIDQTVAATKAVLASQKTFSSTSSLITAGSIVLNGVTISTDGTETLSQFIYKINQYSGQTGITATQGTIGTYLNIELNQNTYGSNFKVELQDTSNIINTATYSTLKGVDASYVVKASTYSPNGGTAISTTTFTGGRNATDSGLRLTDRYGNSINITEAGNGVTAETAVALATSNALQFQVGGNPNQTAKISFGDLHADKLGTTAVTGSSFADIDLTTSTGANNAMLIIDDALVQISRLRGDLGAFQSNVLESNLRALSIAQENLSATESNIRDVDMAEEITNLTRLQILQQSGMAVLAQANQTPQSVLKLLQ